MPKKVLLEVRSEPAYFTLLGISCHLKDYRISYLLNEKTGFSLIKMEDFRFFPPHAKEPLEFSYYYYKDEDQLLTYHLISNRNPEAILVPEMKQTDFLLLIDGPLKKAAIDKLLADIQTIPSILVAFEIKFSQVRNYENLLTDLEMHLMKLIKPDLPQFLPKKTGGLYHA
jgi:hypothetical protein